MKRALFLVISGAAASVFGAGVLPSALPASSPGTVAPSVCLPGIDIEGVEAASIEGGDVFMSLNAARTRLTIKVYTNDDELRRLRPTPLKTFVVDAHNRIVDTTRAPFIPAANSKVPTGANLTSKPEAFPSGTCNITGVRATSDKYGPNMISTDAVGKVGVYADGASVGRYSDAGYALHSNVKDFERSRSNGCIVVRQTDNRAIASVLRADRADAERTRPERRPVQLLHVSD
ncbi:MAG TPA: hypothetical protein VMV44_10305 [Rectinemataceae bacterium]|nr:hypothetical protein [Rectinemataceae bacterium]